MMKSWVAILIIYWLVIHKGRAKSISSVDLSATSAQTIMPLTTTDKPPTTTPETTTMPAPLCIHNGKPLVLGDSIANAENCSGVACTEDGLIHWDYFNCTPTTTPDVPTTTTTTPPQTTTTTTTPPPTTTTTTTPPPTTTTTTTTPPPTTTTSGLCLINGTYYPPESEVYRGYDASTNRCYGTIVHENCVVTNYEFYNCHPKTAPPPTPPPTTTPQTTTTTTPPPTTTPQTTTTTTPPPTTTPQTTTTTTPPPTTTPPTTLGACVHNGRGMKLNEVDTSSCAGAFCSAQGLVEWDHCGCFLGGHGMTLYRYGESILTDSRGCAGMTCTTNGFINWNNCTNTTTTPQSTTTTPDTTPSSTTPLSTTIPSCKYDGQVLELGDNKPTDSRWCSGVVCTENGIVHWDNFNCTATSTPQINTTSPATTTRSTTTPTTTIPAPPCKYNGQAYALGDVIPNDNRWCSGVTCTKNGLIPWDYFNCTSTTNPQTITTTAQGKKTDDPNKIKKKRMKEMIKKMMKLEKLMEIKMDKTITKWGLSEIKLMGKKPFKKLKMKLTRSRSPMEAFKVLIEFKESFAKLINRMRGKIMKNKEKKSAK